MSVEKENAKSASPTFGQVSAVVIVVLLIFVTAIILPDILDYWLRSAQLTAKSTQTSTPTPTPTPSPTVSPDQQQVKPPPSSSPQAQTSLSPQAQNTQPISAVPVASPATPSSDPSKVFEAYGRLITLIVGLVSALGIFGGYFIRKSIKETEEDVEKKLKESLAKWEEERKEINRKFDERAGVIDEKIKQGQEELDEVVRQGKERLTEQLQEAEQLRKEFESLVRKANDALTPFPVEPETQPSPVSEAAEEVDREIERTEDTDD
jgi:uncharacterized membrane-anchored protein YhcB (DUF1043 family)